MSAIKPIPDPEVLENSQLSDWQAGDRKPEIEGPYLRDLDEGEVISIWSRGKWLRDGFLASDIQDVPWCGILA